MLEISSVHRFSNDVNWSPSRVFQAELAPREQKHISRPTYLSVLPVSVHGGSLLLQILQDLLRLLGICLEQVVMCSPRIASVLLKQSEVIVP